MLVPDAAVGAVGVPVNAGDARSALPLNFVQSPELSLPVLVADATGKLKA